MTYADPPPMPSVDLDDSPEPWQDEQGEADFFEFGTVGDWPLRRPADGYEYQPTDETPAPRGA